MIQEADPVARGIEAAADALPSSRVHRVDPPIGEEPALRRPLLVMRPRKGWVGPNLGELWRHRDVLWFLALRDIRVRYKQTVLGVVWFLLQPLITAAVFTLIFGGLARIPSNNIPYALFALSGLLLYNLFSHTFLSAVHSLVANRHLISKVYFPRLIFPLSPIVTGLLDLAVGSLLLFALMAYFHMPFRWTWLLAPGCVLFAVLLGVGPGIWLAALNVKYRDVANLVGFMVQILLYASPIVYPLSLARKQWPHGYILISLNPMSAVVEGFRWTLFGGEMPPMLSLVSSPLIIFAMLVSGLFLFRRMERGFADTL